MNRRLVSLALVSLAAGCFRQRPLLDQAEAAAASGDRKAALGAYQRSLAEELHSPPRAETIRERITELAGELLGEAAAEVKRAGKPPLAELASLVRLREQALAVDVSADELGAVDDAIAAASERAWAAVERQSQGGQLLGAALAAERIVAVVPEGSLRERGKKRLAELRAKAAEHHRALLADASLAAARAFHAGAVAHLTGKADTGPRATLASELAVGIAATTTGGCAEDGARLADALNAPGANTAELELQVASCSGNAARSRGRETYSYQTQEAQVIEYQEVVGYEPWYQDRQKTECYDIGDGQRQCHTSTERVQMAGGGTPIYATRTRTEMVTVTREGSATSRSRATVTGSRGRPSCAARAAAACPSPWSRS